MADLNDALSGLNANLIRVFVDLKPGNQSGLVYPPTYEGGDHIFRPAWVDGHRREAVLLDSAQSQSNRVEEAVLEARRRGDISYPDIEITVDADTGFERYSVLQLSHRVYDAALRFTQLNGIQFAATDIGKAIYDARTDNATALFVHAPITLLLGGWDSHGGGGPLVAKLPRLLTSEIVGLDAEPVRRGAVKFDPMDIRSDAGPVYEAKDETLRWTLDEEGAKAKGKGRRPSEVGLGNVPSMESRGAVISAAIQTSIISVAGARRLRFPDHAGNLSPDCDRACQSVIVALGLYGLLLQMEMGYVLRSGCELVPETTPIVEVIGATLSDARRVEVTSDTARAWLSECLDEAKSFGFSWREDVIELAADERLRKMIERSRTARNDSD